MQNVRLGNNAKQKESIDGDLSSFLRQNPTSPISMNHRAPNRSRFVAGNMSTNTTGSTLIVGKNSVTSSVGGVGAKNFSSNPLHRHRIHHNRANLETKFARVKSPTHTTNVPSSSDSDAESPIQMPVWFHELRSYSEDVIIDRNAIPNLRVGNLYELEPMEKTANAKRPNKYVFLVRESNILGKDVTESPNTLSVSTAKAKTNFQISLLSTFQKLLDIPPRSTVQLKCISNIEDVMLDTVEIYLKDVNFPRDSQWGLASSMVGSCCYVNQRVSFSGNRIGYINTLYKDGRSLFSGYIGIKTNIVFRSESAKLVFLVQMSREMWHFEENGEIMFHKLVNALFPKIFKKWRANNSHHSITIVLFTSVDLTYTPWISLGGGERPSNCQDYYRVVVDQVSVFVWDKIMAALRLEFANFKRDILLHLEDNKYQIKGEPCPAVKGNLLEAINLSLSLVSDRFRNTDLRHSVNHLVVITPGTGIFDVDFDQLSDTSRKMLSLDIALDIVSLSQQPLHTVPLFRYRDAEGKVNHCVPKWCDVSYYAGEVGSSFHWIPRCKIYELQMMGVMENEINEIQIERLNFKDNSRVIESMDKYDEALFKPVNSRPLHSFSESTMKGKISKPVVKKEATGSLFLMGSRPAPSKLNISSSRTNVSETHSSVQGTVTNTSTTNSALSSLYTLNKSNDDSNQKTAGVKALPSKPLQMNSQHQSKLMEVKTTPSSTLDAIRSSKKIRSQKRSNAEKATAKKKSFTDTTDYRSDLDSQYWLNIENPSQQSSSYADIWGRWSHVLPPKIRRRMFKWRSLKAPAALPISTSLFPTSTQLQTDYTLQNYIITLNFENNLELKTTRELMREMIGLRLAMGFQVCFGENIDRIEAERKPLGNPASIIKYFPTDDCTGKKMYLSINDEVHSIFCDYDGTLNVQMYRKIEKKDPSKISLGSRRPHSDENAVIRTRYADEYTPLKIDLQNIKPPTFNWNQFDQLLAGYDDAITGEKAYHKMKFVVMPGDIPPNAHHINNENLSDEEIRVEGLRKLIALIERGKYVQPEKQEKKSKKEEILPEILFYTGNLYDFLGEQAEYFNVSGTKPDNSLMVDGSRFNTNIKLQSLAQELQAPAPAGLRLVDRTWHFKLHPHCFLGNEMVSWLLEAFDDIDSREEATQYGQSLMERGLFRHVENRHGFLDGHYFYEFEDDYVDNSYKSRSSTSGWFRKKGGHDGQDQSQPSPTTPVSSNANQRRNSDNESALSGTESNPDLRRVISQNLQIDSDSSSLTDSQKLRRKKKFMISKHVKYNCDPLRKSFRPELLDVHYDCVHNPEHCYHIRLQWLNTSTKFIDETIINWSRVCERYGLKLVETPWSELCIIPNLNPFHSFVDLKLVLNPLTDPEFMNNDVLKTNKFYYHLHLLKKAGFLLDNRGTRFFKKDNVEICYSWGMPSFKYAQFIHKTGSYIVELRDNGDFFMAPNNVHILRVNTLVSSMPESSSKFNALDSQKVMLDFRESCRSKKYLREVFREASKNLKEEYNADFLLYT
ncbi:hypothetical protein FOB63_001777 [Clavispora lusitaniae]|uniref:uncharacterized protein n=1 Tax=Clavispora lusitaniae TaxID=36911 RepID=UPI00202C3549|nr:hypothetical protein FOB63_001777 [Clavispora lusitaniae]